MHHLRKSILKFAPHVVWTLALSIGYSFFAYAIYFYVTPDNLYSSEVYYLKGMFFCIPLVILSFAIKKTKHIWQYLLTCIILIISLYFITKCFVFTFVVLILCGVRFLNRINGEKSEFESVSFLILLVYIVFFLLTGFNDFPFLQEATLYHFMFSALLIFSYQGFNRFESFVEIRKNRSNLPSKRILDTGTKIFLVFSIIVILFFMPIMRYQYDFVHFELPEFQSTASESEYVIETEEEEEEEEEAQEMSYAELFPETPLSNFLKQIWNFFDKIVLVVMYVTLLYLLIKGIIFLIINFNKPQIEKNDLIESTFNHDEDTVTSTVSKARFDGIFDFSKEMMIRRRFKKEFKRYNPKQWQTPDEIQKMSNHFVPDLHELYEKVRYGKSDS